MTTTTNGTLRKFLRLPTMCLVVVGIMLFLQMLLLTQTSFSTDYYGRPVTFISDFFEALSIHPEYLVPLNWNWYPMLALPFVAIATALFILQGGPILGYTWKNLLHGVQIIDASWQYMVIAMPLVILCMGVLGVGGAGYKNIGFTHTIPATYENTSPELPKNVTVMVTTMNSAGHFTFHFAGYLSMILSAMTVDAEYTGGFRDWEKWLLIAMIIVLLAIYWENKENIYIRSQGGQKMGMQNGLDDLLFDLYACACAIGCGIGLYELTWIKVHGYYYPNRYPVQR
jgi:hypothetical protein